MKFSTREIILGAMFTSMAVIQALLLRFLGAMVIPFSLMPFIAILAGALLGARGGAISMLVYVLMGLIGLPVFEKPPYGGIAYLLQPTFGFLLGFVAAAYVVGKIKPRSGHSMLRYILAALGGILIIYVVGLPYIFAILSFYLGQATSALQVIKLACLPFIGADFVKAVLAAILAATVIRRMQAS